MATKKVGSAGRFGSRYGRRIRTKIVAVEKDKKAAKCPYCLKLKTLKRVASGIWYCTKCDSKFAGKAYKPA
jgi:large subunit ribosomal protein L37Ae